MFRNILLLTKILLAGGAACAVTVTVSRGLTGPASPLYIDDTGLTAVVDDGGELPDDPGPDVYVPGDGLPYREGDWERNVNSERYRAVREAIERGDLKLEERDDVDIVSYGSAKLNMNYGKSRFTKDKYRQFDQDKPVSRIITSGYNPENEMQLHMEGHIGERLTLYIDHDSRKKDNRYMMQYRAVRDDELIREINAGEITIKMKGSKYAVYDDTSAKGLGIDTTIRKGNLEIKAFGSVTQGETVVEFFRGNSSPGNMSLGEYQYIRNTYYQLEAFRRYDGRTAPPDPGEYASLITFTSSPSDPPTYAPVPVYIDPSGFELYLDDQNPLNNYSAVKLDSIDGGYYTRMVAGTDYTINFNTGLITLLKQVPASSRIFAVYTHDGGSTASSDPAARTDVVPYAGKIFVFIKYGYSIQEESGNDRNGDGQRNLDIYEVRSFYFIGDRQVLQENFKLQFFSRNRVIDRSETSMLGRYSVDYTKGVVSFLLREPFRPLLNQSQYQSDLDTVIYSENPPVSAAERSAYSIRVDYYREARSFQLRHFNILPGSVRVKIDNRDIPPSLYSVDLTAGLLTFLNPNNPVIGPETSIEIKYEYLPYYTGSQSFVGGFRADYRLTRDLGLGSTFLYSRASGGNTIPVVGSEPTQTMIFEGDATLELSENRLRDFANSIPGVRLGRVPVDVKAYAEYARSYRKVNTFGKALVDDMESSEEITGISLSDRDWMLSSMPAGLDQSVRGKLYYRYYRDIDNPDSLKGTGYAADLIDYSKKPGPYNVAAGHLSESVQKYESQRSLVFEFSLGSGETDVPVVTRRLSSQAVDFSGLQYVEVWYRAENLTADVDLYLDVGALNEDADGDGVFDTEDANRNGFLDFDPSAGIAEDRGFSFNPSGNTATLIGAGPQLSDFTKGNGVLDSEDLNGNGVLDVNGISGVSENSLRLEGAIIRDPAPYPLAVSATDTAWRMKRIYINKGALADEALDILKRVEAVRFSIRGASSTQGTIYIDTLRFVSSRWRNVRINGTPEGDYAGSGTFSITMVDSLNDPDYRQDAFIYSKSDIYQSLHGEADSKELARERETALQISYDLQAGDGNGSVSRVFSKPMDLRFYKTLNLWVNFRPSSALDTVGVRLGSSENDYYYYEFTKDFEDIWREIVLNLHGSSGGGISRISQTGNPDLKRITYIEFIVNTGTSAAAGKIWINDIYTSGADTLKDDAYWVEGEIRGKRALYYTKSGVPVISDIYVHYVEKGHGSQFSSVGKTVADISEKYRELFASTSLLPNWAARLTFSHEESSTDSLNQDVADIRRGVSTKQSLCVESDYAPVASAVPSVKLVYRNDLYENARRERISTYDVRRRSESSIHSPSIIIREEGEVLWGRVVTSLMVDMAFKRDIVERSSEGVDNDELGQYTSTSEREKRQKGGTQITVDYQSRYFFLQPALYAASQEIVSLSGKSSLGDTELAGDVRGDYHFPFMYGEDLKFVERNKKISLGAGLRNNGIMSPAVRLEMQYLDNRFRDYDDGERTISGRYERAKDARGFISNTLSVPFDFLTRMKKGFVKSAGLSYSRSVLFQENEVPYEGEGKGAFNERYGIERVFEGLSDAGLNLFSCPPWYFFSGRESAANGRDYARHRFNRVLRFPGGTEVSNYSNNIRLIDNVAYNMALDFGVVSVMAGTGINQVSERGEVNGIPQQAVNATFNSNMSLDLMRVFSSGFFRKNRPGIPYHASVLSLGYDFRRAMLITSNIREDTHTPRLGITFKWDRSSAGIRGGLDCRHRTRWEYIPFDDSERSRSDDIYVSNMPAVPAFKELDLGYTLTALYETDVQWLYRLFSALYQLAASPIFSLEYSLILNRYDYTKTVSPEPYDQHLVTSKLTLDLHKNVQGGLIARWALERFRNRDTGGVNREIISYEFGINFTLIF